MATEPIVAPLPMALGDHRRSVSLRFLADYCAVTKPEVNFLITITTAIGFYLGSSGQSPFPWMSLLNTTLGTVLVASGAGTLNQWMEYRFDANMRRTARRPVASGRIEPIHALIFGSVLALAGVTHLFLTTNRLASLLALVTLTSYLFLYTPSKRITPLCTLIGAFSGATPPLIGWAAARGTLAPQAWLLFAIVFLWQFPHFMAIAWMYREDYGRAGYLILPTGKQKNHFVMWQTLLPSLALLPLSMVAATAGVWGLVYSAGAFVLGGGFLYYGVRFGVRRSSTAARQLLVASILYLPAIFVLLSLKG